MSIFISIILISEKFVKEVWRTFLFNNDDTHPFLLPTTLIHFYWLRRGHDHMDVEFTTAYAINAYDH
jgi:hypothetical protein